MMITYFAQPVEMLEENNLTNLLMRVQKKGSTICYPFLENKIFSETHT
jgi:hypothetical protein